LLPIGKAEFDQHLVSSGFVADPYATLQRLQREAPIYWLARAEGEVAFMAPFKRFPTLQMDDTVLAWDSSKASTRALSSLTVTGSRKIIGFPGPRYA